MGTDNIDVSQIESLANLIYKLGPAVVILAVFLLLFLAIIMIILKSFMDNQKKTQEQNEALMRAILTNFESFKAEEESKDEPATKGYEKNIVEIFVKLNNTFKMDCKKYSEKINCDRVGIYVFHNGTHSSHGLPFFKVSCISEWIKRGCGIGPHIKDCNAVPLTIFDDIIERIYSYGFVIVKNSYDKDIDPNPNSNPTQIESSSFFLDRDKAKVAIFVAVYDSFENILAFIMAEYLNDIDDATIDTNMRELREFCARIRPTLEFSDYNEIRKSGD